MVYYLDQTLTDPFASLIVSQTAGFAQLQIHNNDPLYSGQTEAVEFKQGYPLELYAKFVSLNPDYSPVINALMRSVDTIIGVLFSVLVVFVSYQLHIRKFKMVDDKSKVETYK